MITIIMLKLILKKGVVNIDASGAHDQRRMLRKSWTEEQALWYWQPPSSLDHSSKPSGQDI